MLLKLYVRVDNFPPICNKPMLLKKSNKNEIIEK